jgi:hypothetical protein
MWLGLFTGVLATSIGLAVGAVVLQDTKAYERWCRR